MPRTKHSPATRARHKKWLKRAKGYRGRRRKVFKLAKEATLKAGQYAYRDRKKKKGAMRSRWQAQINTAVRGYGLSYSKFVAGLKANNIQLNRKVLAQLASEYPDIFKQVVEQVNSQKPVK